MILLFRLIVDYILPSHLLKRGEGEDMDFYISPSSSHTLFVMKSCSAKVSFIVSLLLYRLVVLPDRGQTRGSR